MKMTERGKAMGFTRITMLVWILFILSSPLNAAADELVTGRYLSASGKEIRVELKIGSPAPPSVILIQKLPKGTGVTASSPELKKYSPAKGKAKWLLSKVKPGKMTISMTLDRAIAKGEVSGEVRCRNSAGKMVSVALRD
jgi:hypothetical protein